MEKFLIHFLKPNKNRKCSKCGTKLKSDETKCPNCGILFWKCPNCEQLNPSDSSICTRCKKDVFDFSLQSQENTSDIESAHNNNSSANKQPYIKEEIIHPRVQSIKCNKCGTILKPGETKCPICGAVFWKCPNCEQINPSDSHICSKCNKDVIDFSLNGQEIDRAKVTLPKYKKFCPRRTVSMFSEYNIEQYNDLIDEMTYDLPIKLYNMAYEYLKMFEDVRYFVLMPLSRYKYDIVCYTHWYVLDGEFEIPELQGKHDSEYEVSHVEWCFNLYDSFLNLDPSFADIVLDELFENYYDTFKRIDSICVTEALSQSYRNLYKTKFLDIEWRLLKTAGYKYFHDEFKKKFPSVEIDKEMELNTILKQYCSDCMDEPRSIYNIALLVNSLYDVNYFDKKTDNISYGNDINYYNVFSHINARLYEIVKELKADNLRRKLSVGFESNAHDLLPPKQRINFSVMTGIDFENFIVKLFQNKGYTVSTTKISGDNGVDVIAEKEGIRIGIQAKCYSSSVGNSAVQEVVAGLAYYGCNRGMVITSNYFTKAARDLAAANNIILWDKDRLDEEISLCF